MAYMLRLFFSIDTYTLFYPLYLFPSPPYAALLVTSIPPRCTIRFEGDTEKPTAIYPENPVLTKSSMLRTGGILHEGSDRNGGFGSFTVFID